MSPAQLVGISLLVIIWWVGVWGCIETAVHTVTRSNPFYSFCVYFTMAVLVLALYITHPSLFTKVMV